MNTNLRLKGTPQLFMDRLGIPGFLFEMNKRTQWRMASLTSSAGDVCVRPKNLLETDGKFGLYLLETVLKMLFHVVENQCRGKMILRRTECVAFYQTQIVSRIWLQLEVGWNPDPDITNLSEEEPMGEDEWLHPVIRAKKVHQAKALELTKKKVRMSATAKGGKVKYTDRRKHHGETPITQDSVAAYDQRAYLTVYDHFDWCG